MVPVRMPPDQRERMVAIATELLAQDGPEALQARAVADAAGVSTQALYTLFGGMPGLFEAIIAQGFEEFADFVLAVPETDDPVADFFARGGAYSAWALTHRELYRLMFGLTGGSLRRHIGLDVAALGAVANTPAGQRALDVMVGSLDRVRESGRVRAVDPLIITGQFLSATHGYLLLEIAGAFGEEGLGTEVILALAANLMVGLGDDRDATEKSLREAMEAIGNQP